jgi:hypothetical protein
MAYQQIDCASWNELLEEVMRVTHKFEQKYPGSPVPFFRGQSSPSYQLLPGLFRLTADGQVKYNIYDERNFYYEFRARAGALLNPGFTSWDVLFLMQHHRVPTRLLDWTESFATALYFALEEATSDIDIWMLDPYLLNQQVVIYNAFLRANYFFVSTDRRFGRGDFYKRVVGQGDVFHRDKVTSECRGGQLTRLWGYG